MRDLGIFRRRVLEAVALFKCSLVTTTTAARIWEKSYYFTSALTTDGLSLIFKIHELIAKVCTEPGHETRPH